MCLGHLLSIPETFLKGLSVPGICRLVADTGHWCFRAEGEGPQEEAVRAKVGSPPVPVTTRKR